MNQDVAYNRDGFPQDLVFQLTSDACCRKRSQTVTTSRRNISALPYAFTEQGVAMLSSVLRSQRAVEVDIAIMRTFLQLRRLMNSNRDLARRVEAMETRYNEQFFAMLTPSNSSLPTTRSARPNAPPASSEN